MEMEMSTASWESNYNRFKIINWLLFYLVWPFVVSEKINYYWLFLVCVYFFCFLDGCQPCYGMLLALMVGLLSMNICQAIEIWNLQTSFQFSTWISIARVIGLTLLNPQLFFMLVRKLKVAWSLWTLFRKPWQKLHLTW